MKNLYFFATPDDIAKALGRVERKAALQYVEVGTKSTPERRVFPCAEDIPHLGTATHETGSLSAGYLVSLQGTSLVPRASTTKLGERRWNLFNGDNPGSVSLTPAGVWKDMVLAGNVGTVHDDPDARRLVGWFHAALKAEGFAKASRFWVGKEALTMLHSGHRLSTTAEQSPPEFDLKPEQVEPPNRSFKADGSAAA
jgi:hypothetical protein